MPGNGAANARWSLGAAALAWLIAAGAAAQTADPTDPGRPPAGQLRSPPMTAPLVIAPPSAQPPVIPRAEQRDRERAPLNPPREDADGRGLLGAPIFVRPGTAPYAAPQYPYPYPYPATPAYGTGSGYPPAPGAGCRQYAPAFDEAGRFLANVCVR